MYIYIHIYMYVYNFVYISEAAAKAGAEIEAEPDICVRYCITATRCITTYMPCRDVPRYFAACHTAPHCNTQICLTEAFHLP